MQMSMLYTEASKVILVGEAYVGKTALMERCLNDHFVAIQNPYNPTVGVMYGQKKIRVADGREVSLGIWDTAGSERFRSMVKLYYRSAEAAILCYDVCDRESFRKLSSVWLKDLEQYIQSECPQRTMIYICGCKKDLTEPPKMMPRAVDPFEVRELAKRIGATFKETSSLTGDGVSELFTTIAQDVYNRQHHGKQARDSTIVTLHNIKPSSSPSSCSC